MIIKIGNDVFDPNDLPCMIVLTAVDKDNIARMLPDADRYCAYPTHMDEASVERWMDDRRLPKSHTGPADAITGGPPCEKDGKIILAKCAACGQPLDITVDEKGEAKVSAGYLVWSGTNQIKLDAVRRGLQSLRAEVGKTIILPTEVMVRLEKLEAMIDPPPCPERDGKPAIDPANLVE